MHWRAVRVYEQVGREGLRGAVTTQRINPFSYDYVLHVREPLSLSLWLPWEPSSRPAQRAGRAPMAFSESPYCTSPATGGKRLGQSGRRRRWWMHNDMRVEVWAAPGLLYRAHRTAFLFCFVCKGSEICIPAAKFWPGSARDRVRGTSISWVGEIASFCLFGRGKSQD